MKELMIHLRAMQFYAHSCHHLVARTPFHQDHEFFGAVYSEVEGDFDGVAERIIGVFGEEPMNLGALMTEVTQKLMSAPSTGIKENATFYAYLLTMEQELCKIVGMACKIPALSEGTKQMIGDICDRSEVRQYKIKQRIKK